MKKKQISEILLNYHWIINEIKRQRKMLEGAGDGITAQYGIEASLPKASGQNGDPVFREYIRREKKSKWVEKLEEKALFIQSHMSCITNEREKAVLECMLDGMSMIAISRHMGLSERHIYNLRKSIVDNIADFAGFADNAGKLNQNKKCG